MIGVSNPSGDAASPLVVGETNVFNAAAPTTWTDLSLAAVVGAVSARVKIKFKGDGSLQLLAVRKKGETDDFYHAVTADLSGLQIGACTGVHCVLDVETNTSGVIQIKALNTDVTTIDVISYIK